MNTTGGYWGVGIQVCDFSSNDSYSPVYLVLSYLTILYSPYQRWIPTSKGPSIEELKGMDTVDRASLVAMKHY